jgi:hypothetical protein
MIPVNILNNKETIIAIETICINAMKQIEGSITARTADRNPQQIFKKLKDDILYIAKRASKSLVPRKLRNIRNIEMQIKQVLNNPSLDQTQQQMTALEVEEELAN